MFDLPSFPPPPSCDFLTALISIEHYRKRAPVDRGNCFVSETQQNGPTPAAPWRANWPILQHSCFILLLVQSRHQVLGLQADCILNLAATGVHLPVCTSTFVTVPVSVLQASLFCCFSYKSGALHGYTALIHSQFDLCVPLCILEIGLRLSNSSSTLLVKFVSLHY